MGRQQARGIPPEEIAYNIRKQAGAPVHFRDLLEGILTVGEGLEFSRGKLMARIHTDINLDPRFRYMGQGVWGLREWSRGAPEPEEPESEDSGGDGDDVGDDTEDSGEDAS